MDYNMLYSHCLIRGKKYEFCIDHDEKATLVNIAVVKELGLHSSWHPHPYYIYFNGRPVYVTLQAWVSIDLNGYKSDMLCDVFPMSGESIVFGRAWLREYEVMYDLSRTQYSFYGMGKKYVLDSRRGLYKEVVDKLEDFEQRFLGKIQRTFDKLKAELRINTPFVDTCAAVEVVPTNEVVVDVNVADDVVGATKDAMAVEAEVITTVEALVDVPDDLEVEMAVENAVATVTTSEPPLNCVSPALSLQVHASFVGEIGNVVASAGSIVQIKVVQTAHVFHDPFLVHCRPFEFVVADYYVRSVHLYKRLGTELFASECFLDVRHYEGLLTYVRPRFLFDPGGFEDESFRTGRE